MWSCPDYEAKNLHPITQIPKITSHCTTNREIVSGFRLHVRRLCGCTSFSYLRLHSVAHYDVNFNSVYKAHFFDSSSKHLFLGSR